MTSPPEPSPARELPGLWRTAGLAALTLWLPALLPLVFGMVSAGDRQVFVLTVLLLPVMGFELVGGAGGLAWGLAALVAALPVVGLTWCLRRLSRVHARFVQTALMFLIAAWSLLWAVALAGRGC